MFAIRVIVALMVTVLAVSGCTKKGGNGRNAGKRSQGVAPPKGGRPGQSPEQQETREIETTQHNENDEEYDSEEHDLPANVFETTKADEIVEQDDTAGEDLSTGETIDEDGGDVPFDRSYNPAKCGEAYNAGTPDWFVGALNPPATTPIKTGGTSPRGYKYTDAHDDSIMAWYGAKFEAQDKCMIDASKELAARITDVDVYNDIKKTGTVKVTIRLVDGSVKNTDSKKRYMEIKLTGKFDGHMNANRDGECDGDKNNPKCDEADEIQQETELVQVGKTGKGLRFKGKMICFDKDYGCQTVGITLQQLTKKDEICREAYAIHRYGPAHFTMPDSERDYGDLSENANHRDLAVLLGNTAHAVCLHTLNKVKSASRKDFPERCVEKLEKKCGGEPLREPFARSDEIGLKTWSVIYGAANFKFFVKNMMDVSGPLVYSKTTPIYDHRLKSSGNGVEDVFLINNDGAGQLNMEVVFKGEPKMKMNFSVASLVKDVRLAIPRKSQEKLSVTETYISNENQVVPLDNTDKQEIEETPENYNAGGK